MGFPEELKKIRQNSLLSQKSFAEELGVSYLSVSRWEGGRTRPNWNGMNSIKEFCDKNNCEFESIKNAWLDDSVNEKIDSRR